MPGTLTHSPGDILRWWLIGAGHGTDPALGSTWPIWAEEEGDSPDNAVTVFSTDGISGGRVLISGQRIEQHGLQVRVRARTPEVGYPKARALAVALDGILRGEVAISGTAYTLAAVNRTTEVIPLGKDPISRRSLYTINAVSSITQQS